MLRIRTDGRQSTARQNSAYEPTGYVKLSWRKFTLFTLVVNRESVSEIFMRLVICRFARLTAASAVIDEYSLCHCACVSLVLVSRYYAVATTQRWDGVLMCAGVDLEA